MKTSYGYRSDFENYPPYKAYFQKVVKYQKPQEKFVVDWQLQEDKREKGKLSNPDANG